MDNLYLKFQGLHPSEVTRAYLGERLHEVQDKAPRGSMLNAVFSKKDKLVKATIKVTTSGKVFFASATGYKMKYVSQDLIKKITKQLEHWRTININKKISNKLKSHKYLLEDQNEGFDYEGNHFA